MRSVIRRELFNILDFRQAYSVVKTFQQHYFGRKNIHSPSFVSDTPESQMLQDRSRIEVEVLTSLKALQSLSENHVCYSIERTLG